MDEINLAECSDEDEYARLGMSHGRAWSPGFDEVASLYQRLKSERIIEFHWKCPGRRNPNEEVKTKEESQKPVVESMDVSGAYDFDFDDDAGPVPQKLTPKSNTPKVTTKKRTTLAGIVANMEKHRIMDKMGTETPPGSSK